MANIDWTLTWNTVLAISTALMVLAIAITAGYAIVQLRHIKKTRCSDLLMRLDEIWDSKDYIHSRWMINKYGYGTTLEEASQNLKEAMMSFDEVNAEEYFIIVRVANFFENLGLLTHNDYLTRKEALGLFGSAARRYWRLFSDFAYYRRQYSTPKQSDAWVYFESLSMEVLKKNRCLEMIKTPIRGIRKRVSKNATQ